MRQLLYIPSGKYLDVREFDNYMTMEEFRLNKQMSELELLVSIVTRTSSLNDKFYKRHQLPRYLSIEEFEWVDDEK